MDQLEYFNKVLCMTEEAMEIPLPTPDYEITAREYGEEYKFQVYGKHVIYLDQGLVAHSMPTLPCDSAALWTHVAKTFPDASSISMVYKKEK